MKIIIKYSWVALISILMLSCDIDSFKKEIPIDTYDSTPRLVVSAALDNNMLYVYINRSFPISAEEVKVELVEKASVKLYEDNVLILETNERDKELNVGFDSWPSLYILRKDMKTTPGKTYRLEVSSNGYPSVTSTVIAPDYPKVENIKLNHKTNIVRPDNNSFYTHIYSGYCKDFFPLTIELTDDKPREKNYYIIEAFKNELFFGYGNEIGIATTDRLLIQDNPLIESENILSDAEKTTFLFDKFLITDLTFPGRSIKLDLLLNNCGLLWGGTLEKPPYCRDSMEINMQIKSITHEVFDYYRSYLMQNPEEGVFFFSEPVTIRSNINEGYGYFSVTSIISKKLLTVYY